MKTIVIVGNTICAKYWNSFLRLAFLNLNSAPISVFYFCCQLGRIAWLPSKSDFAPVRGLPSFPVTFAPGTWRVGHGRVRFLSAGNVSDGTRASVEFYHRPVTDALLFVFCVYRRTRPPRPMAPTKVPRAQSVASTATVTCVLEFSCLFSLNVKWIGTLKNVTN